MRKGVTAMSIGVHKVENARLVAAVVTLFAALLAAGILALVVARSAEAAFSGANGEIVFASDRDTGAMDIFAISPSGGATDRLTTFSFGHNIDPAVSPDGSRIAFSRGGQIWVMKASGMKADGTGATQITDTSTAKTKPAWSPDGTRIAYVANSFDVDGQTDLEIWAINADGSGRTQLTNNTVPDDQPAWSPDGTQIAFVSARSGDTNRNIYLMNSDGSGTAVSLTANSTEPLYQGHDDGPSWSPDGSEIAYSNNGDGDADVYKMDANPATKDWTNLTDANAGLDVEPAWSPDDDSIAYVATSGSTDRNIYVMSTSGASPSPIDTDTAHDISPDWQPSPPTCDLRGTNENNILTSDPAKNEVVCGLGGNDTMTGQEGDILLGGDGNDTLVHPSGRATLDGGPGKDTASFAGSATPIQADLTKQFAVREETSPLEGVALLGIESLTGSSLGDKLTGSSAANKLVGGDGADTLLGSGGKDTINSRDGVNRNDTVNGGAGADKCTTDRKEASIKSC